MKLSSRLRLALVLCSVSLAACDYGTGTGDSPDDVTQTSSALITTRGSFDYANQCGVAGVPIPPPWGLNSIGDDTTTKAWKYKKTGKTMAPTDTFLGIDGADVYYYVQTTAPTGVCVIAAHAADGPGLFDMICQGTNGKACFWEGSLDQHPPADYSYVDLFSALKGGTALGSPIGCTSCHAGQNVFITHLTPGTHPLNLTSLSQWMPSTMYEAIATRPGPDNTRPPMRPEVYGTGTTCTQCHSATSTYSPKAGQFPDVTSPDYNGYCGIIQAVIKRPGTQGGMPPSNTCSNGHCAAESDPWVLAMLDRCGKGTAQSKAISPIGFEGYSSTSPYSGAWDHVLVGKKNDITPTMELYNNVYYNGFQGWSENAQSSTLNTSFRPTMWLKNNNGSAVAVASTDASGNIWEQQAGVRLVSSNAAGSPWAYIRHDGYNIIVYRGYDNYIYESYWANNQWYTNPLPGQTIRAMGDPVGYNRGGSSSVIYKCGASLICEERLIGGVWKFRSFSTPIEILGETMPMPFKRDYHEERSIFYAAIDGLHVLSDNTDPQFDVSPPWDWRINTNRIASSPIPYNAQDGGTRVVYVTDPGDPSASTISEAVFAYDASNWVTQVRVNPPKTYERIVGDPYAYVASAPWRNTIIYRNSANTIYQLQTASSGTGNVAWGQSIVAKGQHLNSSGSATANQEIRWAFDLPAGHYRYDLTVSSGDVDLYVKLGSEPTTTSFDCRPYLGSTNPEACTTTISDLKGGTVYVMARGFNSSSTYSIVGNHY